MRTRVVRRPLFQSLGLTVGLCFCLCLAATSVGCASHGTKHKSPPPEPPAAVAAAIAQHYPAATVVCGCSENEDGVSAWETVLLVPSPSGLRTIEVTLTLDGTVLSEEETITEAELPGAVATALSARKGAHGMVRSIDRTVTPTTRDQPTFEVLLIADGMQHEMVFDARGAMLSDEAMAAHEEHEDHDGDKGDEGEDDDD